MSFLTITPTRFAPVTFANRAAFPITLNISWEVPTPPAEGFWGLGAHTVFDPGGFVPEHDGIEAGSKSLTYSGPADDTFYYTGIADISLNGGPVCSQPVRFVNGSVSLPRLSLQRVAINAAANAVLVHGGTLTAAVTFHDMHLVSVSGPSAPSHYFGTDLYDASGVLDAGPLKLITIVERFDLYADPRNLLPRDVGQVVIFYFGDTSNSTDPVVYYSYYWIINPAGTAFTYSIDHGATFAFKQDGGAGEDWVWNAVPPITTLFTVTITYGNGLVITRSATMHVAARQIGDHADMAQDHASGLITIVRSVNLA